MTIEFTQAAKDQIAKLIKQHEKAIGIKISVQSGGCSGFEYVFEMIENVTDDLIVVYKDTVTTYIRICVDQIAYAYLNGSTVDYQETLLKSGFVFNNPNEIAKCGCGRSFNV